ncbi:hypothetical protein CIK77_07080 [Microbacterium sp. JB110]|nr:hypothetical protein CIK77_07080 [Microbacterium sp. JB110]SJM51238.1 hypothetical protein CZ774_05075 [Frigoribacterium sp. JB110]
MRDRTLAMSASLLLTVARLRRPWERTRGDHTLSSGSDRDELARIYRNEQNRDHRERTYERNRRLYL